MSRKHHALARANAEARDATRRSRRHRRAAAAARAEQAVHAALSVRQHRLSDLCRTPRLAPAELALRLDGLTTVHRARLGTLVAHLERVVPRVASTDNLGALIQLSLLDWVRPLDDLARPRGKGRRRLLHGVIQHLVARFPIPPFLFNAFDDDGWRWVRLVAFLGEGRSPREAVRGGLLPVPLTRRGCHLFLRAPASWGVLEAVRRAQVAQHGGDVRLADAVAGSRLGRAAHGTTVEAFWDTVVAWFARQPMLDPGQVGPLVDYLARCHGENAAFSIKGRSVAALMRGMEGWHRELEAQVRIVGEALPASGLSGARWVFKRRDEAVDWRIDEILGTRQLAAEGRALHHCVLSYAPRVRRGMVSIWSLTRDGHRCVTIEVANAARRIVQARGACNRSITVEERAFLVRWATEVGLSVGV